MNDEQNYIDEITKIIDNSDEPVQQIDKIVALPMPNTSNYSVNVQVLASYIAELKFDWDNFETGDTDNYDEAETAFVSSALLKIKQILSDIKDGKKYKRVFIAELAYSRLVGDEYKYKMIMQGMKAKTVQEATTEIIDIKHDAPKTHPDDLQFGIEDVRTRVEVIDEDGRIILKDKFLLTKSGE